MANFDFIVAEANLREKADQLASMTGNEENYASLEREYNRAKNEYDMQLAIAQREKLTVSTSPTFSFMHSLRESRKNREGMNLRAAISAAGLAGKAIETEMQSILEPLYAKSVLAQLGVKWYKGMPMGDISIPVMNAGSVSWATEEGASQDGTPTFASNVTLSPKRLTAHFDITEQMLMQDTLGVEEAIKRDAINALTKELEATIFGKNAGSTTKPAGIFYNQTLSDATTFKKLCDIEAGVEDANVYGEMTYLLSTKAKADLRSMVQGKTTKNVLENGTVDGTKLVSTSIVNDGNKGVYCYGDFSNLAVASWGDIIFKVDDSVAYANGKIRIYVTGYFDAKVLRPEAFAFGDTRYSSAG